MQTINMYYDNYESLSKFVTEHHNVLFDKDNPSVLVQVFCGICDKEIIALLLGEISELVPHAEIIGATTSGEIMNGKVSALKTVLSFSIFKHSNIKVAYALQEGRNSYELGRSIAGTLIGERTRLLVLFSSGMAVNASQMLMGVQSVNPQLPIAGGNAGDNFFNRQGFVFCKNRITDCGVVGVALEGEHLAIHQHWHLCWKPIGKEMSITRAEGSRVYTIDNIPAFQIYRKYLGEACKSNIINSIFPLITSKHGIQIVKAPSLLHDDDSIEFFSEMIEGEKIRFSFGYVDMILETIHKLLQEIKKQPVESIFVYSCALRRGFLQDSTEIETLPLQEIAPTAGFFTNGEFYHVDNTNQLLHATMTTLALSEVDQKEQVFLPEPRKSLLECNTDIDITDSKDNVKSKNIAILKALTALVDTVTKELEERTAELERVNKNIQYASIHDPLTGLYNRGFYEEEMKRLGAIGNDPLGIIICDVDGLKLVNDTLGHSTGDTILKATADILRFLFSHDSVVARIGGDEFSVLIPECSQSTIEDYCQRIREAVASYNIVNPTVPLSVSIGFSCCGNGMENTNMLFKEADNSMYREKLHRSKSIRSDLVQTLVSALEARDIITKEHGNRLQKLVTAFAGYIDHSKNDVSDLQLFARFHDIGKVGIPDSILFKQGELSPKEKKEMQRHCEIGYRIAQSSTDLLPLADWILKHHEWWNGKGYPLGLKGEDIPVECRIVAIVDAYDAMTSDRPYRKAMSYEAAIAELKRYSGVQFDPNLVERFVCMLE